MYDNLNAPELAPFVDKLRAITPIIYVRTDNADELTRLLLACNIGQKHSTWTPLVTTNPSIPWTEGNCRVGQKVIPAPGFDPVSVAQFLLQCDPKDGHGLGIIKVEDATVVPSVADAIKGIFKNRWQAIHRIVLTVFMGKLPATQAVPENLRDFVSPVDLIDGCKTEGVDPHVPANLPSLEDIRKTYYKVGEFLLDKGFEETDAYKAFEGMTLEDMQQAMALALVKHRKLQAEKYKPNRVCDPEVIDAHKNRWARVA